MLAFLRSARIFHTTLKPVAKDLEEMTGLSSQDRISMLNGWQLPSGGLRDQTDSVRRHLYIRESGQGCRPPHSEATIPE